MKGKSVGISQQTTASATGYKTVRGKRLLQYVASLSSNLGTLGVGMALGWTAVAGGNGEKIESAYNIKITPTDFSWIGSLVTLGAATIYVPVGILADTIGRKYTMLVMAMPYIVGWLLIIFAKSVLMLFIGRLITGFSTGTFCVVAPMYTAEIAESEIRGRLGSYFQLLLSVGILLTYVCGSFVDMYQLSIISIIFPFIFFATFIMMPESPIYYLKKGNEDEAKKSLIRLRGREYDVENELRIHREALEETRKKTTSVYNLLKSEAVTKSFIISYGLMVFQQFSGMNVVVFYAGTIFYQASGNLDPKYSIIILGVIQLVALFLSTMVVDRLGRKVLLIGSSVFMCLSAVALGVYYYLADNGENVDAIQWLPLLSVCVFSVMFSFGLGPLPWMMMGEIFAPEGKGSASSTACLLNSMCAFLVTKFFVDVKEAINLGPTFWMFAVIIAIGIIFVHMLVPETKGKSLVEIQQELNAS